MTLTEGIYYKLSVSFIMNCQTKKQPRGNRHVVPQIFNICNATPHVISQIKYVQHVFTMCDW